MARDSITVKTANGSANPAAAATLEFTRTSGLAANDLQWVAQEGDLLLLQNNNVGAAAVTIVSVDDEQGRTEDIVLALAAGEEAHFGPLQNLVPWAQSDGNIHVDIDVDTVDAIVIRQAGKL